MSYYDDVTEFHHVVLGIESTAPTWDLPNSVVERIKFMEEELYEFEDATRMADMVKAADALADLVYVALGTAHQMGLPFDEIWASVHKANMQKMRGIGKRGMVFDAVKPPEWVGPETEIEAAIYAAAS
jgi:predicted HAD superfamily Cof-like phosphohydrolase